MSVVRFTNALVLLLLLAGGTTLLAGGELLSRFGDQRLPAFCGATLFFLAATCGVLSQLVYRRNLNALSTQIHAGVAANKIEAVDSLDASLSPLTRSLNEMLNASGRQIADANLRAKELQIQLKVAHMERQHAEAILHSISDAVLVTDPFDDLVLANESAARTFEFSLDDTCRAPIDQVLREPKMVELIKETRQSAAAAGRRTAELKVKTAAGLRTYKVTLSNVAEGQTGTGGGGVVSVLQDMTREKEIADMKNDFVSNVSHELRTPLASIKAYVEMLIDGEAEDEKTQNEFYEIIQGESNRLSRLIDNILNISRIESGLTKVNKLPLSPAVVMRDAIEVITPQAKLKNIEIKDKLIATIYQTHADRDMVYQAMLNLLSNAVKYTPEGGTITVEAAVDEARKVVIARVSDTGVGIPAKDLPFVFDKFYRVEANNKMAKGTGLGLSLVKHIVEGVHQGKIICESTVGKGSSFGFELPLSD